MDAAAAEARRRRAPYCPRGCLRTEGRRGLRGRTCHRGGSRGGGRRPRAPASSSGPTAPGPSCRRRRRRLPRPHDDNTPSPPPSASPGPAPPQPRGLRPPSRGLPRAGRVPARATGARAAGRMHGRRRGRRKEAAARPGPALAAAWPAPVPGGAETRPHGPAAFTGLVGRGDREEAAGVGTAAEPPPERPLMKARPPPPARSSRRRPRPRARWSAGQGPRGCLAPGPGPG